MDCAATANHGFIVRFFADNPFIYNSFIYKPVT